MKLFGFLPPFAAPIPFAALLWAILRFTGHETRTADTWLFFGTLVAMLLIGGIGALREKRTLNNKARR